MYIWVYIYILYLSHTDMYMYTIYINACKHLYICMYRTKYPHAYREGKREREMRYMSMRTYIPYLYTEFITETAKLRGTICPDT